MLTAASRLLTTTCRLAGLALLPLAAAAQTITGFTPTTAAPGATVTITGTNLGSLKSVMLNGLPVKTTGTPTAAAVQVVVPRAAATGRLRLTTASGTAITATKLGITRQSSAVSFAQKSASSVGSTATGKYSTPTVGDLDNDNLLELIMGQGDGTIMVFEQTATNATTFNAGTLLKATDGTTLNVGPSNANGKYAKPTLTDLDGNGLLELLVGEDTGTVLRYEQTAASGAGALVFGRSTLFTNPYGTATSTAPNAGSYARPTVADLDSNGLLDVLVGSNNGTMQRYEQTAANALTFTALGQLKDDTGTAIDVGDVDKPLLTDYNGDGYLDMLVGNKAGSVVLYTQTGSNAVTFKQLGNLTTDGSTAINMGTSDGGYAAPTVTDIDNNGLLDLYLGNGNGTIYRFEQTQSATSPTLAAPLPVQLVSFGGQATSAGSLLSWATASELSSAYFAVERSADGAAFAELGRVAAAGSSASARSYQYLDAAAPAGTSYYRLRQVDQDGTVAYSPVVAVSQAVSLGIARPQAFPTAFTSELNVLLPGADAPQAATVALLTADGRAVYSCAVQLSAAPQALPSLPLLASGLYLLRVATAAGTSTQRVSRQ